MALQIVGIGELKVSSNPADVLVTHALGSCIAVVVYDQVARVAGLLHFMLPDSSLDCEKAGRLPCMFADTGIALLVQNVCQLGAVKSRILAVAAGGAHMLDRSETFNVGQRNLMAMRRLLNQCGIAIDKEEIGGTSSRTISIAVANGRVHLRTPGKAEYDVIYSGENECRR